MTGDKSDDDGNASPPRLDYAQRPGAAWVGRHRRLLIVVALVLAIATPIVTYWGPLKHRVLWFYWFHQAANHVMPGKAIELSIAVDDPAGLQRVQGSNEWDASGHAPPLIYSPEAYRGLLAQDSRLNLVGPLGEPIAFMGTLHRPDGTPRLVIIRGSSGRSSNVLGGLSLVVLPAPGWFDPFPPVFAPPSTWGVVFHGGNGSPSRFSRLKSGVPDPQNPSHIVFDFVVEPTSIGSANSPRQTGVIDAYLQNNDSITFGLRSYTGDVREINLGPAMLSGKVELLEELSRSSQRMLTTQPNAGR